MYCLFSIDESNHQTYYTAIRGNYLNTELEKLYNVRVFF